jgi:UDP-N-acetylmuramoyl-tripeptide--D-alanyl-D-alanine ligase
MFREFMIKDAARMINGISKSDGRELIRGVSINSKTTKPGDLFFALKGEHTDGHFYVNEALMNGAVAAVVESSTHAEPEILVSDTLFALGQLAQKYREFFEPKTIAITGTNGKTTVKNLIGAILSKEYRVLHTEKNYNSLIGLPLTIFNLSGTEDYLVVEMGTSSSGEIKRLCEIAQPDMGIITNVGPGHLKGLGSLAGVRKEKLSLIDALPEDGLALVGEGIGALTKKNTIRFSLDILEDIQLGEYGSYFTYSGNRFFTPLLGVGNVSNCLAAILLTSNLGVSHDVQRQVLAETKPGPGRLEPLYWNRLFIINDTYNANPISMKVAIDFTICLRREKIFVLGDMLELGRKSNDLHREIGDYARKHCNTLLTFGDMARHYQGRHFDDKTKLVHYLLENLNGDEAILIKASRGLKFETIIDSFLRLL